MRKLATLPAALAVAAVAAAPAAAQERPVTEFTSKASISPKKVGTKKNPRGVTLSGRLGFNTITQGVEAPIVTGGDVYVARGGVWNGGRYDKCSARTMRRAQSTDRCPRRSIMGNGKGVAFADTVDAAPDVEFVNGGAKTLWAFTTLYRPALVREPIPIRIRKMRGKWAYRATFEVPRVLQVVAGVPVTLRSFRYRIGGKPHARKLLTTTSCPRNNRFPYRAVARYLYSDGFRGSDTYTGTIACRR